MPIEPATIPPPVINQHPTYHLEATPYTHMSSFKPSVLKVGECSVPYTSEYREDNLAPISLLSLLGDVKKVLQSVITSGELDLDELNPDKVNMPETWVPVDAIEQIGLANSVATEEQD